MMASRHQENDEAKGQAGRGDRRQEHKSQRAGACAAQVAVDILVLSRPINKPTGRPTGSPTDRSVREAGGGAIRQG